MTSPVNRERWTAAQQAELSDWERVDLREVLRICAEKPEFLLLLEGRKGLCDQSRHMHPPQAHDLQVSSYPTMLR